MKRQNNICNFFVSTVPEKKNIFIVFCKFIEILVGYGFAFFYAVNYNFFFFFRKQVFILGHISSFIFQPLNDRLLPDFRVLSFIFILQIFSCLQIPRAFERSTAQKKQRSVQLQFIVHFIWARYLLVAQKSVNFVHYIFTILPRFHRAACLNTKFLFLLFAY